MNHQGVLSCLSVVSPRCFVLHVFNHAHTHSKLTAPPPPLTAALRLDAHALNTPVAKAFTITLHSRIHCSVHLQPTVHVSSLDEALSLCLDEPLCTYVAFNLQDGSTEICSGRYKGEDYQSKGGSEVCRGGGKGEGREATWVSFEMFCSFQEGRGRAWQGG